MIIKKGSSAGIRRSYRGFAICLAAAGTGAIFYAEVMKNNDFDSQQRETTRFDDIGQQQKHRLGEATAALPLLRAETASTESKTTKTSLQGKEVEAEEENEEEELPITAKRCNDKLEEMERRWDMRRDARIKKIELEASSEWFDESTFDLFEPEAVCIDEERFGGGGGGGFHDGAQQQQHQQQRFNAWGDGPKYLCGVDRLIEKAKAKPNNCLVYSIGSDNNVDFEMAISNIIAGAGGDDDRNEKICEIHTFDPTIQPTLFEGDEYSIFHDWGFGQDGKYSRVFTDHGIFTFHAISVETAMEKLGHQGRKIDILKIDCEGCEFIVLTQALEAIAASTMKIDQIQAEIHGGALHKNDIIKLFKAADNANMRVFHKERNGWGCQGHKCVEYSFVSKDFLRKVTSYYVC